jgi:HSP20 family protein
MDRLMDEAFGQTWNGQRNGFSGTHFLPIDVYTNEDAVVLVASLPGLTENDVEIIHQADTITIKGEFKAPEGNVQWAVQERPYGKFSRTLTLNVPFDANKADATFENGVLTLTLPKADWAKPRNIAVKSQKVLENGQQN